MKKKEKTYHPTSVPLPLGTKTMLLRHDRTEAEERLLVHLLLALKQSGYSGEIHCRCFLANQDGKARRPDLYLPRYALPIEVDGRTRDSWIQRQDDLAPRDSFYESIGALPPLRIPAAWMASDFKVERFLSELQTHLFKKRLEPKDRGTIAKRICDGRKILEGKKPGIFDSSGLLAPQFIEELGHHGFNEFRHFGGTKFILRGKYNQSPERFEKLLNDHLLSLFSDPYAGLSKETRERIREPERLSMTGKTNSGT